MAKHKYGSPVENDILELQGVEYVLQPYGMGAFRQSMTRADDAQGLKDLEGRDKSLKAFDLSVDVVVNAVAEDQRDEIRAHIERSVPPSMLMRIASDIMQGISDVDPTQPESSSDGSSVIGDDSTAGASDAALTPASSPSVEL